MYIVQIKYLSSKSAFDSKQKEMELYQSNWLKNNGYSESSLCDIEDDELFGNACEKFENDIRACEINKTLCSLKEDLTAAENELIKFAISFLPDPERNTMKSNMKNAVSREKIIHLALLLKS